MLVTSRPILSNSLCPEFSQNIDQHIEITGFSRNNIDTYINGACRDNPALLKDLRSYMTSHPFISSVMYNPLHCTIVTELYTEFWQKRENDRFAPSNLTQLYTCLLQSMMLRYLSSHPEHREKKLNIKTLSDLPSDVHEQLMQLAKLAAQGIEERRYIFDEVPCEES